MVRAVAVCLIGCLAGVAHAEPSAQQRFAAATLLEARGQYGAAADALEALARDLPADPYAPDALFEAAVVSEERLADPRRAERLYRAVAKQFPDHRLARRAHTRAEFLAASLKSGEEPLRQYEEIINTVPRSRAEARARMEQLLAEHPDFTLADRALYWVANAYVQDRQNTLAIARFAEVERRFPSSEWALRAKKARAELLLGRGQLFAARALFRELQQSADPLARAAAVEGLADFAAALLRVVLTAFCSLYLIGFAAWQLVTLRGRLRRLRLVPVEALYYLPVAALFVGAALSENYAVAQCTAGIAVGGAVIVWLNGGAIAARLERGPLSPGERFARAAACALAVVALTYLAIQLTGLGGLVAETFRAGPERD